MDYDLGPDVAVLRERLRDLIREEVPDWFRGPFTDEERAHEVTQRFCRRLAEERLLTLSWPTEYGGAGASVWEQTAMREEMWASNEPRGPQYMGASWVGPAIMRFGTDEQKARHLPPIAAGEVVWCQCFSEPEAGSDLASLQQRAEALPDGRYRLNGQKVWTSYALLADWCFLAARTSTGDHKRDGITIFLVPMDAEGVAPRPIDTMMGPHHLNEVFFTDVEVGHEAVLGEVDCGWDVINAVLSFERVGMPRYARIERILSALAPLLDERPDEPALPLEHARALVGCRVARLLSYRAVAFHAAGEVPLVEPAVARVCATLLEQEAAELALRIAGPDALAHDAAAPLAGEIQEFWRYARAATISSGTVEIQRLLAARGLIKGLA